mmetsp:Transcript_29763/g.70713  ORF Transcript_29763/g.70713 Transcript_29763/m.70713 type:complete len:314 (+) Transcript_29763:253-1194(+)
MAASTAAGASPSPPPPSSTRASVRACKRRARTLRRCCRRCSRRWWRPTRPASTSTRPSAAAGTRAASWARSRPRARCTPSTWTRTRSRWAASWRPPTAASPCTTRPLVRWEPCSARGISPLPASSSTSASRRRSSTRRTVASDPRPTGLSTCASTRAQVCPRGSGCSRWSEARSSVSSSSTERPATRPPRAASPMPSASRATPTSYPSVPGSLLSWWRAQRGASTRRCTQPSSPSRRCASTLTASSTRCAAASTQPSSSWGRAVALDCSLGSTRSVPLSSTSSARSRRRGPSCRCCAGIRRSTTHRRCPRAGR